MPHAFSNPSPTPPGAFPQPLPGQFPDALYKPSPIPPGSIAPPVRIANTGWHSRDEIHSFAGLGGRFSWPESPFVFARITFAPNPFVPAAVNYDPGQSGFYAITFYFGGALIESGLYHTGVANFVVPPRMLLEPTGVNPPREFFVDGMYTDVFFHTVQFMLLRGFTFPTPTFVPTRTP